MFVCKSKIRAMNEHIGAFEQTSQIPAFRMYEPGSQACYIHSLKDLHSAPHYSQKN